MSDHTSRASQLLSECLLKGMVMTASSCKKCSSPLMRHRKNKDLICPFCSAKSEENATQDSSSTSTFTKESKQETEPVKQPPSAPSSKSVSSLLSRKMVEGWTLTETICPELSCPNVPLVQDKEKYCYCVSCNKRYLMESDYDSNIHKVDLVSPSQSTKAPGSSVSSRKLSIELQQTEVSAFSKATSDLQVPQLGNFGTSSNRTTPLPAGAPDVVFDSTRVLQNKIAFINQELSSSTQSQDIKNLASALTGCFDALSASIRLSKLMDK